MYKYIIRLRFICIYMYVSSRFQAFDSKSSLREKRKKRRGEGKFSPNPGNTMMVVEGHQQRQLQRPNKSQKHRLQLFPNSCNKQPAFAL